MSLYNDSKRDWDSFSNGDWSSEPDPNACPFCDGPTVERYPGARWCGSCEELIISDAGTTEALGAARIHWSNKRAASERVIADRKDKERVG